MDDDCSTPIRYLEARQIKKTRKDWVCDQCGHHHEKGGPKNRFVYINGETNQFEVTQFCADPIACTSRMAGVDVWL